MVPRSTDTPSTLLVRLMLDGVDAGVRWSALQIPVRYLPWTLEHAATQEVESALASIDDALKNLG